MSDGATTVLGRSLFLPASGRTARADKLNLTGITDTVTATNNQTLAYSPANRLNSAVGPYGTQSWIEACPRA